MDHKAILPFIYVTPAPKSLQCPIKISHVIHFTPSALALIGEYYSENEMDPGFNPMFQIYGNDGETIDVFEDIDLEDEDIEFDDEDEDLPQEIEDMLVEHVFLIEALCFCKEFMGKYNYIADEAISVLSDEPLAVGIAPQIS